MPPKKKMAAKPVPLKKVHDLAAHLAIEGFSAGMYGDFTADELAQYCLDVAQRIFELDDDDE